MPTADKSPAEVASANQYHSYLRGWVAGTAAHAKDPQHTQHTDATLRRAYIQGYNDGHQARNQACDTAAARYGYTPNFMRAAPGA